MCIEEFTDAAQNHYQESDGYSDLEATAEEANKNIDDAWESVKDTVADNIYSDIDPLVHGWIQRHGCQITEAIKEALDKQDPGDDDDDDEDDYDEDEEDMDDDEEDMM